VRIESAPGRSTTVRILVPEAHGTASQDRDAVDQFVPVERDAFGTVLLVDEADPIGAFDAPALYR
jgi:hypothetical protein